MRVLLTGHDGYIGTVMSPVLAAAGHEVVGLDSFLFGGCGFGGNVEIPSMPMDVRDVQLPALKGLDAIVHLAAICNDPVGNLDPSCTYAINHEASVRLAELAKEAGIQRFLFSSSCSLYGASNTDELLTEEAAFNPVTPYGMSKVLVERDVARLADDTFSPVFLRNATAYGVSPRLRADVVLNNLAGYACTTGEVLIHSDGSPWRPLVHVEDIARAFVAALEAPREAVHNQAFNVGADEENYRIRDLAEIVMEAVPGSSVTFAPGGGPDIRDYRVGFDKIRRALPSFTPRWTVREGVAELVAMYRDAGITREEFLGPRFVRLERIRERLSEGSIDAVLRPVDLPIAASDR